MNTVTERSFGNIYERSAEESGMCRCHIVLLSEQIYKASQTSVPDKMMMR